MKNLIKNMTKNLAKGKVGKVLDAQEEKENSESIQEEQEQLRAGDIIKYAKEITLEVTDEEGNRIPCKTIAEAEILSRLIELRELLIKIKFNK